MPKVTYSTLKSLWQGKLSSLDFDLIVQKTLNLPDRSRLITLSEIPKNLQKPLIKNLKARARGVPLAYIFHEKEFYGRNFYVGKSVLIPRPETEFLIETALEIIKNQLKTRNHLEIIDVGTGSGNIAISLYKELEKLMHKNQTLGKTSTSFSGQEITVSGPPSGLTSFSITALDKSPKALKIATKNAKALHADINFCRSDLLKSLPHQKTSLPPKFDLVLANLPYVDKKWHWLDKTSLKFEPSSALYAADHGLALITKLLHQIKNSHSTSNLIFIILELDPCQQSHLKNLAESLGYTYQKSQKSDYIATLFL